MRLNNVQVLRAIAAIMVVHAHAAGVSGLHLSWFGGANGVDLFFVISGFIIAYVAHADAQQFMTRRLIRIVPIYWASTLAVYALVIAIPRVFHTTSSDPALLIRSLFFLPASAGVHTEDGIAHPTLAGGWTLNYEMYFYVVFWLALLASRRWASLGAVVTLACAIAVLQLSGATSRSPVAFFYGNPIVLEFMYGIVAYHLVARITKRREGETPSTSEAIVLLGCVVTGFVCLAFNREIFGLGPRWLLSGVPAFVVVVSAVLLEQVHGKRVTHRVPILVGDASYVLYLLHAYVVFGVIRLVIGHRTFGEVSGQALSLVLVAISLAVAVVVYVYFEQPMLKRLKKMFVRARARPA